MSKAPFIPSSPDDEPVPPSTWRVFGTKSYFRLWLAQVVSSTGDWIGLIALLAIAARVSSNPGAAVSLVMLARVVPGFFLGTIGGVLIDRFDRRLVMVCSDVGRAALLVLLPFVGTTLLALVLISFLLEIFTLLWGPAKDASVPHLVGPDQLSSANTLSLVASYGTFPLASVIFSLLAALAAWLGGFNTLHSLEVDQEALALFFDAGTFLVSAVIVWGLPIPKGGSMRAEKLGLSDTVHDIKEGLSYIAHEPRVRGVIVGLGLGLIGAGAMIPLGPVFAQEGIGGDAATFGVLMSALGFGAATGVVLLLFVQKKIPRETVFDFAVMGTGIFLMIAATLSALFPAALAVTILGACAGTSYVTGFTVLQETVQDELRGRIFAVLYTVIRMCLLVALVISPLWAEFWDWAVNDLAKVGIVSVGGVEYAFPGVRVALWVGGLIAFGAGIYARWSMMHAGAPPQDRTGDVAPDAAA
ncbi:MAG: MFS transporter [Actinomycetota bacterium]